MEPGELTPRSGIAWTRVGGKTKEDARGVQITGAGEADRFVNHRRAAIPLYAITVEVIRPRGCSIRACIDSGIAGQRQQRPVPCAGPRLRERRFVKDPERHARRVMSDNAPAVPPDNDDVVKAAGTIFDQRDDGPATIKMGANKGRVTGEGDRLPTSGEKVAQQVVTADATGFPVNEGGERFGIYAGRTPVAHHHGGGGAAAERLALRQIGHVKEAEGLSSGLRAELPGIAAAVSATIAAVRRRRSPGLQSATSDDQDDDQAGR